MGFSTADWLVVAAYLVIVVAVGIVAGRPRRASSATSDEAFLASRSMPSWAVAISVVATSLSAATFIGGPQQAYVGDLTYFSTNLGGILAVLIVAFWFIPAFYRAGVTSIYELLGARWGPSPRRAASAMFMLGRVFASGARLFMVAIPFALVAFGETNAPSLIAAIVIIAIAATVYLSLIHI